MNMTVKLALEQINRERVRVSLVTVKSESPGMSPNDSLVLKLMNAILCELILVLGYLIITLH